MHDLAQLLLVLIQTSAMLLRPIRCEAFVSAELNPDPNERNADLRREENSEPPINVIPGSDDSPCAPSAWQAEMEANLRQIRDEQRINSGLLGNQMNALRQQLAYNATLALDAVVLGKLEKLERQLEGNSPHGGPAADSALTTSRPSQGAVDASYQLLKDELTRLMSRVESQRVEQEAQRLQLENQRLDLAKLRESQSVNGGPLHDAVNASHQLLNDEMTLLTSLVESQRLQLEGQRLELGVLRESQQRSVNVGTSYIRWGRTTCNGDATTLYKGYTSGSKYDLRGGASNLLCLHETPQWNRTIPGQRSHSLIYGVEYEIFNQGHGAYNNIFSPNSNGGHPLLDHPAACALCHVPNRSTKIMIPAKRDCPSGFTKEYDGYIMAEHYTHHRSSYECWDDAPETVPGASSQNHALVYPTEVVCGSLPCSKFVNGFELTCVVCTK